jgi:hypothetical protein
MPGSRPERTNLSRRTCDGDLLRRPACLIAGDHVPTTGLCAASGRRSGVGLLRHAARSSARRDVTAVLEYPASRACCTQRTAAAPASVARRAQRLRRANRSARLPRHAVRAAHRRAENQPAACAGVRTRHIPLSWIRDDARARRVLSHRSAGGVAEVRRTAGRCVRGSRCQRRALRHERCRDLGAPGRGAVQLARRGENLQGGSARADCFCGLAPSAALSFPAVRLLQSPCSRCGSIRKTRSPETSGAEAQQHSTPTAHLKL